MTEERFGLSQDAIDRIRAVFAAHPEVEKAILYGSRAKGGYRNGSDIDLTLHGNRLDDRILMDLLGELDDLLLPYTIDLSIFAALHHPALEDHIRRVGRIFYEKSGKSL
jgi:predicted nucleotidyltransferase